ncbi:MAG: type II toxin-antitoxin system VapC family toxin [Ignavibacteriae bacterium]|nr:type II toxin-antitoxin system VapC family toxin [Ignavibacteriota bacterium]
MTYLLDTNTCIFLIKRSPLRVLENLEAHSLSEIGISMITVAELEYGVEKSQQKGKNRQALERFLLPLELVEFNRAASQHYGEVRAELQRMGQPIGLMDMLIAAHARSLGVTLVSNNLWEFSRVRGLKVEDWTT